MKFRLEFFLQIFFIRQAIFFTFEDEHEVIDVSAIVNGVARLPCKDQNDHQIIFDSHVKENNSKINYNMAGGKINNYVNPNLVIWYKFGLHSPIYSFDKRNRGFSNEGSHWSNERIFGGRAYFNKHDSILTVQDVKESDSGLYKCRLDFDKRPTENFIFNLSVIVPPKELIIIDRNKNLVESELDPMEEGNSLKLICSARGGRPAPTVVWKQNDEIIDQLNDVIDDNEVQNILHIERVERKDQGTIFKCETSNNFGQMILFKTVQLNLLLKPLDVRIEGENIQFKAGKEYKLSCVSFGSRPPANLTWWLQGHKIHSYLFDTVISADNNRTSSILRFQPKASNNRAKLTCKANNSFVYGSSIATAWHLKVDYAPIVQIELGRNLNRSLIKEGVDVYFDCNVDAVPSITKLQWIHNGVFLVPNTAGIITSNQTLVLQTVTRRSAGNYSCLVANEEGESESIPFNLNVKYEPSCNLNQQTIYGAVRFENIHVICEVDCNPPATEYRWQFNNSLVQMEEVDNIISNSRIGRVVIYEPKTDLDYGTLLCWAKNELSWQTTPCLFHIIPAGKPDGPQNCSILNVTENSIHVACEESFDGGLPQKFICEVVNNSTGRLLWNVTNQIAEWNFSGLSRTDSYTISVYSTNGKGRSFNTVHLNVAMFSYLPQTDFRTLEVKSLYSLLGVIVLGGILLLLVILLVALVQTIRHVRKNHQKNVAKMKKFQENFHPSGISDDECDPDIIPHNIQDESCSLNETEKSFNCTTVDGDVRYLSSNNPLYKPPKSTEHCMVHWSDKSCLPFSVGNPRSTVVMVSPSSCCTEIHLQNWMTNFDSASNTNHKESEV